ncbi:MAG: LysE family transporter, partial [Hyphomicrobiales bacterium]|nr:LysE family transporter [Hyphomicrobiales bacterium]
METVAAALAVLLPLTMSPGPVGFALAAIVMSFGAWAAIPFVLGVQSAAILVGIASALGLSQLFIAYPSVQMVLRYAGTAYVAWLGWKFLNAHPKPGGELSGHVPG